MGAVYWFTGLSGAGKTTLGESFFKELKKQGAHVIFLDGDAIRDILGNPWGHSIEDRKKYARSYGKLCQFFSNQGVDVVCATISMFHEIRHWNRNNIARYQEIYVKVPLDILKQRDSKGIYSKAREGEINQVMGMDLEFEEPLTPDCVIVNDGTRSIDDITHSLIESLG
ncbi:MAG: adenylyl-sulfate kinase [Candidatus Nitrohelix vancouverensis]|uniref:Adenylyl-sulfate kinase n=1 Tax=Candidatus Nitrohelix vancouverensis TaxID=2705534 RepID=A0A7T0C5D6_9BACT|nr:MAG: adenylyl-sulfate kinase [Candidatus Nitrohelix vancouverensis]